MPRKVFADCHKLVFYTDCRCAECHYAECHYADCHYAECRGAVEKMKNLKCLKFERKNHLG